MVGNQLPILLIDFSLRQTCIGMRWESVTNPLDRLLHLVTVDEAWVGNQLPILLIDFRLGGGDDLSSWESVTNPLDRLQGHRLESFAVLGISYQSS